MAYQAMLAMAKKSNFVANDPCTRVHNFLNDITDPLWAQSKLSFDENCEKYSGNFEAAVQNLMNQFSWKCQQNVSKL